DNLERIARWDVTTRRRVAGVDSFGRREIPHVVFRKEDAPVVRVGKQEMSVSDYVVIGGEATLGDQKEKARLLALSPNGRTLVAGRVPEGDRQEMLVTLHQTATGREVVRLPPFQNWLLPTTLAFSADSKVLM